MAQANNNTANNKTAPQRQVVEIDLVEIFELLLHWLWLIVLVGLVFGAIGYAYSRFVLPEEFQSTTQVYVKSSDGDETDTISNADLQAGTQLTQDYIQMVTSRYVLETVINNLQLPYDSAALKSKIKVSTPSNTRMLSITVTDNDPQAAQTIANEVRVVASERIVDVMGIGSINVVDEANFPTVKSAPNITRNAMVAALLGIVLVSSIIILRHVLDDTIKSGEDIERYLGLSSLALIPLDDAVKEQSDGSGKKSLLPGKSKERKRQNTKERKTVRDTVRETESKENAQVYEYEKQESVGPRLQEKEAKTPAEVKKEAPAVEEKAKDTAKEEVKPAALKAEEAENTPEVKEPQKEEPVKTATPAKNFSEADEEIDMDFSLFTDSMDDDF